MAEAGASWSRTGWNHDRKPVDTVAMLPQLVGCRVQDVAEAVHESKSEVPTGGSVPDIVVTAGDVLCCMVDVATGVMMIARNGVVVSATKADLQPRAVGPCLSFRKPLTAQLVLNGPPDGVQITSRNPDIDVDLPVFLPVSRWIHRTARAKVLSMAKTRWVLRLLPALMVASACLIVQSLLIILVCTC